MGGRKHTRTALDTRQLPTPDELQEWHSFKDAHGPTFAGSPSWKGYLSFLEDGFRKCGVTGMQKDPITYSRWFTSGDRNDGDWSLYIGEREVRVASYWPHSGSTEAGGITAPLIYYDDDDPPGSIEGKIAVFEIPPLPDPLPPLFDVYRGFEYVTGDETPPADGFSLNQWYQIAYPALFGGYDEILRKGRASGGLVISAMGPARASGVYMLPYESQSCGVPALYLDRRAGTEVKDAALQGLTATLKLLAKREEAETFFLSGFLPGKQYGEETDEVVLLLTHTDGPNLTQENGALGILALLHYFSRIPQEERRRTLLAVLDPQHYMPGRHAVDWFGNHPEASRTIVASMGLEHLGQLEYREEGDAFLPTGKPEVTRLFVQDNDHLIEMAIEAVKDNQLPRTYVHCPPRSGGRWEAMGAIALERDIPGYGFSTDMSAHWSLEAGINTFDSELAFKQIAVATQLTSGLMDVDLNTIRIGPGDKEGVSFGFEKPI